MKKTSAVLPSDTGAGLPAKIKTITIANPRIRLAGTEQENRAFEFFFYDTGHALVDALQAGAVHQKILQISHCNDAIKSAVMAVGSMGERLRNNPLLTTDNERANAFHDFALLQYGKGIQQLRKQISRDAKQSEDVAIIACLLFGVFEFLQGNGDTSRLHLTGGVNLVAQRPPRDPILDPLAFELRRVYSILVNQAVLWLSLDQYPSRPLVPDEGDFSVAPMQSLEFFDSLEDASGSQNYQFNRIFNFRRLIASHGWTKAPYQVPNSAIVRRDELMAQLRRWPLGAQDLCSRLDSVKLLSSETMQRIAIIHMNNLHSQILLSVCLEPAETLTYAEFNSQFSHIVALATSILRPFDDSLTMRIQRLVLANSMHVNPHDLFAFFPGLIPPLHFTAMKCVDKDLCRAATALLSGHTWREGAWESMTMAKSARERLETMNEKSTSVVEANDRQQARYPTSTPSMRQPVLATVHDMRVVSSGH